MPQEAPEPVDNSAVTKQQKEMQKRLKMLQNEMMKMNEKTKKSIV